jgi:hypothetical protein
LKGDDVTMAFLAVLVTIIVFFIIIIPCILFIEHEPKQLNKLKAMDIVRRQLELDIEREAANSDPWTRYRFKSYRGG